MDGCGEDWALGPGVTDAVVHVDLIVDANGVVPAGLATHDVELPVDVHGLAHAATSKSHASTVAPRVGGWIVHLNACNSIARAVRARGSPPKHEHFDAVGASSSVIPERANSDTTSGCKHQSAPNKHGHQVNRANRKGRVAWS